MEQTSPAAASRAHLLAVGVVFIGYCLAAAVGAAASDNAEFIYYLAVMVVLGLAVLVVHRQVGLTSGLLWALAVWGGLHMAGGLVAVPQGWPISGEQRVLYSWWLIPQRLKFDNLVHAYGFAAATWLMWQCLGRLLERRAGAWPRAGAGLVAIAALAGVGLGACNEVVEFAAVLLIPDTNVGGYVNTGWDLVSNSVGALVMAVLLYGGAALGIRHAQLRS